MTYNHEDQISDDGGFTLGFTNAINGIALDIRRATSPNLQQKAKVNQLFSEFKRDNTMTDKS